MQTAEFIYVGEKQIKHAMDTLSRHSAWFKFDPRPFEECSITVKTEHAHHMPLVFYVEHDGDQWRSVFPYHMEEHSHSHEACSDAALWIRKIAGADADVLILNQFQKAFRLTLEANEFDVHANNYDQAISIAHGIQLNRPGFSRHLASSLRNAFQTLPVTADC